MKKSFFALAVALLLLLSACDKNPTDDNITDSSEISDTTSLPLEETEVTVSSESNDDESTKVSSAEETTEESIEIIDSEESSEESQEVYVPTKEEICNTIASITDSGFVTNITDAATDTAIAELSNYLASKGYGIFYCDLEFNGYVAYGCNKDFKTASTSKLPYIKYLATLVDSGEANLNEKLCYNSSYYDGGSGILKKYPGGGYYTVATLMDYVLRYSDNIAYKMLFNRYGLDGFTDYLAGIGVDFSTYNGYGDCTAAEMGAMLYDAALYDGSCLELMQDAGCNASYNYQIGAELSEYRVFQKYGAIKPGNIAYHDIAIVYAPHPYILVIYTTIDYDSAGKNAPFRTIARLVENLNTALYGNE